MSIAERGNTVTVHYTGTLNDGTVFDTSTEREPLSFTLGAGQMIPGFEKAVIGMAPGESKTVTIIADEAYGHRREDLVVNVAKTMMPENLEPEPGQQLQLRQPDGFVVDVVITDVTDTSITLDANHPLAGMDLIFDIELVEVS